MSALERRFLVEINLLGVKMSKILLIFLLGLFLIGGAFAQSTSVIVESDSSLGVTPGRTTMDFSEGLKKTVSFEILNPSGREMNLILSAQGNLSDYIILDEINVKIPAGEFSKTFTYDVSLPDKLTPGLNTGEVVILELPSGSSGSDTGVNALLGVVTQIYVYVPYPGKYANSRMSIFSDDDGGVSFFFPVVSLGEFDLVSVHANVDIYDNFGDKVDSFNTKSISVPSGEKKEIVYKWGGEARAGEYRAVASLVYDGEVLSFEENFGVGTKELDLQEITVNDFSLGQIAKLEMLVENKWSEAIVDAYIETKIYNEKGDVVSGFKSASYDIEPLSKKVFVSYWDTAGVRAGTYETHLSINYDEKVSEKSLKFKVDENDFTVLGLGYVISAGDEGRNSLVVVLVIIIVALVLINLLWFLVIRKKLKK
jgi:hypothetical protein